MAKAEDNLAMSKARDEITKSIHDLCTVTITLPLGNPNLKLVHTNQFLFTELPTDVFELANMDTLTTALNSSDSRYSGYQVNRWYIEKVRIKKKADGTGTMELTLNPFASTLRQYHDNRKNLETAYTDAVNQQNQNNQNNNNNVKSTTEKKLTVKQAVEEVGHLMEHKKYKRYTYSDYTNFVKHGYGDCWAGSYFISCELEKRGVTTRIIQYGTKYSDAHRSVRYKDEKGKWYDFPYRKFKGISSMFYNTQSHGSEIKKDCPKTKNKKGSK